MALAPQQLVIIGDSGVYGWGDRDGGGWSERLRKNWMILKEAPIIYSLGIRGDGLEKVAKRWKKEWGSRGELRRKVPDALLLSIGLNDTARIGRPDGRPQLSAEAYRFGLRQLLKEIKSETFTMMMGLTPVNEEYMPFADCLWYSNESIEIYEAQIEKACLDVGVPFLPLYQKMIREKDWQSWIEPDGIHLNSKGHEWIYKKISGWEPLKEWSKI